MFIHTYHNKYDIHSFLRVGGRHQWVGLGIKEWGWALCDARWTVMDSPQWGCSNQSW